MAAFYFGRTIRLIKFLKESKKLRFVILPTLLSVSQHLLIKIKHTHTLPSSVFFSIIGHKDASQYIHSIYPWTQINTEASLHYQPISLHSLHLFISKAHAPDAPVIRGEPRRREEKHCLCSVCTLQTLEKHFKFFICYVFKRFLFSFSGWR